MAKTVYERSNSGFEKLPEHACSTKVINIPAVLRVLKRTAPSAFLASLALDLQQVYAVGKGDCRLTFKIEYRTK